MEDSDEIAKWESLVGKTFVFPNGLMVLIGVITRGRENITLIFPEFVGTPRDVLELGVTVQDEGDE